jgi:hypothetical protein
MKLVISLVFLALGVLSVRGVRWAYITFVLLGLLYFPASVGFRLDPQPCELAINIPLAIHSLTNYGHIVRFALFTVMTSAQFRSSNWSAFAWAAMAATVMGVLIEIDEGVTGKGHCRLRDMIPNAVGVLLGTVIVLLWNRLRRTPRPS